MPNIFNELHEEWKLCDKELADKKPFSQHELIATKVLLEDDANADTIVFSIGCANNSLERAPNFAIELAKRNEKISVYNFDQHIITNDPDFEKEAIIKRLHPNMTLRFLTVPLKFPRLTEELDIIVSSESEDENNEKSIDNLSCKMYAWNLIEKKQKNPNFKFVLLFTIGSMYPNAALDFINKLEKSGLFTRGKDLELIVAYGSLCPQAAVLRDYCKDDIKEYIYLVNKNTNTPFYSKTKCLYFYPNLDNIKNIFSDIQLLDVKLDEAQQLPILSTYDKLIQESRERYCATKLQEKYIQEAASMKAWSDMLSQKASKTLEAVEGMNKSGSGAKKLTGKF